MKKVKVYDAKTGKFVKKFRFAFDDDFNLLVVINESDSEVS